MPDPQPPWNAQRGVLLVFVASLAIGCAADPARPALPKGAVSVASVPSAPAVSPAVLKVCGARANFGGNVEDVRQKLCCSRHAEGIESPLRVWQSASLEQCISRYAPGVPPSYYIIADSTTREPSRVEDCLPGVVAQVVIPTPEFEALLDSGSRLRIESCVGSNCAQAVLEFDNLARDDELVFALEGRLKAGALLTWNGGAVWLRVRVVQPREQVIEGERYRLTLTLDEKPLRGIDSLLAYHSPSAIAGGVASTPPQCPVARAELGLH